MYLVNLHLALEIYIIGAIVLFIFSIFASLYIAGLMSLLDDCQRPTMLQMLPFALRILLALTGATLIWPLVLVPVFFWVFWRNALGTFGLR